MYKSIRYEKSGDEVFAVYANYNEFYDMVLQKVKMKWNRIGNDVLGLSDSKVSRLFSGKQKDFDTLVKMAEFMQMKFQFRFD